jgi:CRISPR-associated protein Cas1
LENVLVVASPGARLGVRRGVVYVFTRDGRKEPVTADTELVLVLAGRTVVSARALRRLAEMGVRVLVMGQRGQVVAELRPVDRVNRTVEARIAQYRAKVTGAALRYAASMVKAKIVNQARLLRYLAKSRRETWLRDESYRVEDYAYRVDEAVQEGRLSPDLLRNLEAQAARRYWQLVAAVLPKELGFTGREPRGDDPFNKALSYGYAILYGLCYDALIVAGLDPYAGFLHADRSGRESLVYDFSDPFKPVAVDYVLLTRYDPQLFDTVHGALSYEARKAISTRVLDNMMRPYTDSQGRRRRLRDHVYAYAWSLAASLRRGLDYTAFQVRL